MSQLSYVRNTAAHDYLYDTFGARLSHWAKTQPNKPALIVRMSEDERSVLTFGELFQQAEKVAKYFVSLGVQKGDRVAVFIYNSKEWLIVQMGCALAGAVALNSFTFPSENNFESVLNIGCKVLVADLREDTVRHFMVNNIKNLLESQERNLHFSVVLVGPTNQNESNMGIDLDEIVTKSLSEAVHLPDNIDPEEPVVIFQTSGSTGVPKFVPHSHADLLCDLYLLYTSMELENGDIFFSDRPMGYMAGFPMCILVLGMTFVTLNSQATVRDGLADKVCKIIKEESVNVGYLPPYMVYDLEKLKLTSPNDIPHFKSIITSGQRLSRKLLQQFCEYSDRAFAGYGSTECCWVTSINAHDLPEVDGDILGFPLPGIEMKVVDEDGHLVPSNTEGEIYVRSTYVTRNYTSLNGDNLRALDDNGWFRTGDIGFMLDDKKNFCIKGRSVEIIKRATIKIFPASIETVLLQHPAIAEAVVVGVPDERLYQEICACLSATAGKELHLEEIRKFALDHFRPEMTPDGYGLMPKYFYIMEQFPRLPSQKINRQRAADMAAEYVMSLQA